jgi:putative hydrolase of the HAD superfamily
MYYGDKNIMLIIFDLDDTLIDTSGSLRIPKLHDALRAMIKKGLHVNSFEEAFTNLVRIDESSVSGKNSFEKYVESTGSDPAFIDIACEEYYKNATYPVIALEDAIQVLSHLRARHTLVLVSYGDEQTQREKMRVAGVPETFFEEVLFTNSYDKKEVYEKLLVHFDIEPSHVVVVGDKFKTDLLPAKELGMITIHMEHGRGKNDSEAQNADFSVSTLIQLLEVINCKQ